MLRTTTLLDAPCVFCGYNGQGFWQPQTHSRDCPWYKVGGEVKRYALLRETIDELEYNQKERDRIVREIKEGMERLLADKTGIHTFIRSGDGKAGVEECKLIIAKEWQTFWQKYLG